MKAVRRDLRQEAAIPDEVMAFFGGAMHLGYVATRRPDGELAVVPVGVAVHEGAIRISSPGDTCKLRNLRHDPHIAVCVPEPSNPRRYLMVRGIAEVSEDADRAFLDWIARTHMGLEKYPQEPPEPPRAVITIRSAGFVFGGAREAG